MSKKTLYMETTEIAPERSAAEVSAELIKAGATQINTSYENGKVTGLKWVMRVNGMDALFEMPARVEPIYDILKSRNRNTWLSDSDKAKYMAKAERVAWRQLLRWVQAQNAMIDCGMVRPMEVFTAYWIPPGQTQTLIEGILQNQFKQIEAPKQ